MKRNFGKEVERGVKIFERRRYVKLTPFYNGLMCGMGGFTTSHAAKHVVRNYGFDDYFQMLRQAIDRGLLTEYDVLQKHEISSVSPADRLVRVIHDEILKTPGFEGEENRRREKYDMVNKKTTHSA